MPCYNDSAYISKALSTIAEQSFTDYKVLLVNDASTDDSKNILFAFMAEHPSFPVRYWNAGKNQGMMMAESTYILFNDADDWMDPDQLQIAHDHLRDKDLVILEQRTLYDVHGNNLSKPLFSRSPSRWYVRSFQGCFFQRSLIQENDICFSAKEHLMISISSP